MQQISPADLIFGNSILEIQIYFEEEDKGEQGLYWYCEIVEEQRVACLIDCCRQGEHGDNV